MRCAHNTVDIYDGIYSAVLCQFSVGSVIDLANMTASRLFLPIKHSNGEWPCQPEANHLARCITCESKFGAVDGTWANQKYFNISYVVCVFWCASAHRVSLNEYLPHLCAYWVTLTKDSCIYGFKCSEHTHTHTSSRAYMINAIQNCTTIKRVFANELIKNVRAAIQWATVAAVGAVPVAIVAITCHKIVHVDGSDHIKFILN